MNSVQQEIATPKACNRILLLNAAVAAIITAGAALTVFVYSFSRLAAAFMPIPALVGLGFVVWQLVKLKEYKTFAVLGFFAALAVLLGILVVVAVSVYTVLLCLAILVLVSVYGIFMLRHDRDKAASAAYGLVMCLAAILIIYFRNKNAAGFEVVVWKTKTINMNFKSAALTLFGITIFSTAVIFLISYLFYLARLKPKSNTKYITYTAMFAAMSVLFKILGNSISNSVAFIALNPYMRLTFVYIPWVVAGIVLGPAGGMLSAGIGDLIGQILLPGGGMPWFWLTWISNILFPLFPSLTYLYLPLKKKFDWLKVLLGTIISTFVCSLGLGTYALALTSPNADTYFAILALRWPQPIIIGINYFIILSLLPILQRLKITKLKFFETVERNDAMTGE